MAALAAVVRRASVGPSRVDRLCPSDVPTDPWPCRAAAKRLRRFGFARPVSRSKHLIRRRCLLLQPAAAKSGPTDLCRVASSASFGPVFVGRDGRHRRCWSDNLVPVCTRPDRSIRREKQEQSATRVCQTSKFLGAAGLHDFKRWLRYVGWAR